MSTINKGTRYKAFREYERLLEQEKYHNAVRQSKLKAISMKFRGGLLRFGHIEGMLPKTSETVLNVIKEERMNII